MSRVALVLGAGGQDGFHLTQLLSSRGYRLVLGDRAFGRVTEWPHFRADWEFVSVDLRDIGAVVALLDRVRPDEIYNLAGISFIPHSWEIPVETVGINGVAVVGILEWMRQHHPEARFLQTSSSEMFGDPDRAPQTEATRFAPKNPYAIGKLLAHHAVGIYRERYGLFACGAILYNHESPQRAGNFVTRKIAHAAASIKLGRASKLLLGNLQSQRDWGYAGDYVEAMVRMLQAKQASDFVIGTGELHSVQECVEIAFQYLGLDWERYVEVDASLMRPLDHTNLVADPARARELLGWQPKTSFKQLIQMMVDAEMNSLVGKGAA